MMPLYTELKKLSEKLSEPYPDICTYMPNLPSENVDIIYALIYHHALQDPSLNSKLHHPPTNVKKVVIPYKGKLFDTGKGIIYHIKDLPTDLYKIIVCYIQQLVMT